MSNALNKATAEPGRLPVRTKLVYAWGDHTVNLSLSALSLLYFVFLANVVGLRPALAGAVPLIGRAVDAFTDPLMGRLSDLTRFRAGRRRPYFLIGALPFGASFALLWSAAPMGSQGALFAYYGLTYVLYSVSVTVLSVPYLALLPEMALDYDERTSLNTYRSAAAILGTLAAVSLRPLAEAFGGGREGFASAGAVAAVWLTLPWLFVYAVSFERKDFQRPVQIPFREAALAVARHGTYRRLCALFLCARIAVDLIGAMFLPFFIFWLGRPGDFDIALPSLLICVVLSLPLWLQLATHTDKRSLFVFGACWWIVIQGILLLVQPDWPRWTVFLLAAVAGIGYAVADLMPWSMLGDVIDEDELASGERREGLYAGFFTFLRKLGGAFGVFLAGVVLDLSGFVSQAEQQSDGALLALRGITTAAPALFLAFAVLLALRYPLTRARHRQIRAQLDARSRLPT